MAKAKPTFLINSYGIYSTWDAKDKALPKILSFSNEVIAELDVEFGLILNVKQGKGIKLSCTVYHPNVCDKHGVVMEPFEDEVYVKSNNWDFYFGDTLWEPLSDKSGTWRFVISYQSKNVADISFDVVDRNDIYIDEYKEFNKLRKKNKKR